jgi:signal transduction histidine kinase
VHTPFLIGIMVAFTASAVCVTAFFVAAWRERREEREYLYFALAMLFVAAYGLCTSALYAATCGLVPGWDYRVLLDASAVPVKPGVAFMFHFALRYAGVARARRYALPVHALMGAFAVLGASGHWWVDVGEPHVSEVGGLLVHFIPRRPSHAAVLFYPVSGLIVSAVVFLTARVWWRSREGLATVIGAVLLGVTSIHDLAVGGGWIRSLPLFEIGFVAFTYGLALTVVGRYARTASQLELSTEALRKSSRELRQSLDELRHTQQRLVRNEQLAVVGELAAVIAHEVRNPLAIVGNAVASLRKRGTTRDDRRTLLEIINEEMSRLDTLVGRLINYARPVRLQRAPVSLAELCERSAAVVSDVTVAIDVAAGGSVVGDGGLLRQAFENLLSNALQAGAKRVDVRIASRDDEVVVRFTDDGEGMDAAAQKNALSPFFTTRPTGTGLGLPIVARIVQAHGGRVELESAPGAGTTVTLHLPERRAGAAHDSSPREAIALLP